MHTTVRGLVIRSVDYREADKILTAISPVQIQLMTIFIPPLKPMAADDKSCQVEG